MDFSYSVIGFLVGAVVGLTGVGGGSLMTPTLVLFFGIKPAIAVGTDLLYAAITKAGGVWVYNKKGAIRWRIVGLLSTGSIPATIGTVFLIKQLKANGIDYTDLIIGSLSIALIFTALFLLTKNTLQDIVNKTQFTAVRTLHRRYRKQITILAGALIGTLVTLSSVGAGVIGAALLLLLYPRLRTISIIGTDLAHAIPITAIAGLGHLHLGNVDFILLGSLLIGSLPGIYIGSHVGNLLSERVIRPILAIMLLIIGIKLSMELWIA